MLRAGAVVAAVLLSGLGCTPTGSSAAPDATPSSTPKATTAEPHPSKVPPAPADLQQGRTVYRRACLNCHGDDGQGRSMKRLMPKLASFAEPQVRRQLDDSAGMEKLLREGRGLMPAFERLGPSERQAVLAYVRSLAQP